MTAELSPFQHVTVLLHEAVDALNIRADGVYVDGTFGRGGHSRLILSQLNESGKLIVFDKDPQAIEVARNLAKSDNRVHVIHNGFAHFQAALNDLQIDQIDGALFDLGISSPQIDDGSRGFSFRFDAPLDMRMDTTRGQSAAEWLAVADEQAIHEVIKNYGEERFSRQIARAIITQRQTSPITTTHQLAQLTAQVVRTRERGQDPATRTFQAIRIFINRELDEVAEVLPQVVARLNVGGRLAVIAFHSLEDRIVKQFIRTHSTHAPLPKWAAVREADLPQPPLIAIGKAIKPSDDEIAANPRARSAVLRVAERTAGHFQAAWKTDIMTIMKFSIKDKLPEKVKPMATKTNIILLLLVLWSAYHVVDLNNSITHETQRYGKAQEQEIRLNQDYAELQYEFSQAAETKMINNAAVKLKMHAPSAQETVILELR